MSSALALLATASAEHRRAVAVELGLAPHATAVEIANALLDPRKLGAVVDGLSEPGRRLLALAAFEREPNVCASWSGRADVAVGQLERHGLAFAFRDQYETAYHVPHDLHAPLADVLAAPYDDGLERCEPARWLHPPLQLAHDLAALWAHLARFPVRVKADGPIYQRDTPKLLAALPALELHGDGDPIATYRLQFALEVLLEEQLVALRMDNLPGSGGRRELVASGDPVWFLALDPAELRDRMLSRVGVAPLGTAALALARRLGLDGPVAVTSFGAALHRLSEELRLGYDLRTSDFALGIGGVHFLWLAGAVAVGVDRDGVPCAVRAVPAPALDPGRIVCQANFELVALAPPTPAERLVLELTCERDPEQEHVFRLTRGSVRAGERCGILDGGAVAAIERVAGELPQNVARSLTEWARAVRRPLKLRTALLLDTGDAETADALLAGAVGAHVVERIGPAQLAIRGSAIGAVRESLREAGHELDPGLERVSGHWRERDPAPSDAERVWTAREAVSAPAGMQCSTIDHSPRPPGASGGAAKPAALTDGEPVEVVLRAIGARGDPRRDLDAHALRAGRADERDVRAVDERAAGVRAGDHQTV